jgi:hypothetical protein
MNSRTDQVFGSADKLRFELRVEHLGPSEVTATDFIDRDGKPVVSRSPLDSRPNDR